MTEDAPTGREFEALVSRIDAIDGSGTRGTISAVSVMTAQLAETIKDLAEMKGQLTAHEKHHEIERERQARDRTSARRWLIGTLLTVVTLLVAILAIVAPLALRFPHG
jgi:hypothetical protein